MTGTRLRRVATATALVLAGALAAVAFVYGFDVPGWSLPLLAGAALVLFELVSLARGTAPDTLVERPALVAGLGGRLLVAWLLAVAGGTVALVAAAVPARHGLATGLVGAVAVAALFLLVSAVSRRSGESGTPG